MFVVKSRKPNEKKPLRSVLSYSTRSLKSKIWTPLLSYSNSWVTTCQGWALQCGGRADIGLASLMLRCRVRGSGLTTWLRWTQRKRHYLTDFQHLPLIYVVHYMIHPWQTNIVISYNILFLFFYPRYWRFGQPNHNGPQSGNCAAFYYHSDNVKTWYNGNCQDHQLSWICEMEPS